MDTEQQLIEIRKQHKRDCEELEQRFDELKKDLENNKKEFNKIFKDNKESNDTILNSVKFELYDNILQITYLRENRSLLYEKLIKKIKENDPTKDTEQAYEEAKGKLISNEEIRELLTKEQIKEMYKEDRKDFECINLTQEQLKVYKKLLKYDNAIISIPFEIKDLKKINLDVLKNTIKKEIENTQKIKEILEDRERLKKEIFDVSNEMSKQEKEVQGKLQTVIFYDYENLLKILEIGQKIDNYFNIQDYPNLSKRDYEYRLEQEEEMLQYIKDGLEEKKNSLATYQPKPTKAYTVFNDKISNSLAKLINNQKEIIKGTGGKNKGLEIKAIISNAEITQDKVLTAWDKCVLQAIYSLSKENSFFSLNMIKKALSIKKYRDKTRIDTEIIKSIEKMSITKISLDIAKELNETYKTPLNADTIKALGIESYLLPLEKIYKEVGGAKQEMYYFIKPPIYFTYIEARGQILSLSTDKMQIYALPDTKENIMLKNYLGTRIEDMKHQRKTNKTNNYINIILYDTIFKENDLLQDDKLKQGEKAYNKKRDTYRNTIKEILQHFKDIKEIKDFKEIKESRKYNKIQIIL